MNPVPLQIYSNIVTPREDVRTTQKEADLIIMHQLVKTASGDPSIKVICNDTDVFVLLLHFYDTLGLSCNIIIESPVHDRTAIDIKATT